MRRIRAGRPARRQGERDAIGSVWFCAYDDARDQDAWPLALERVQRLLLPCGADFDQFLSRPAAFRRSWRRWRT